MVLVSVIVPNYNHAQFLDQRLISILNQTYKNIEIVLLDDNSSDDSQSVLEQYRNHPKVSHLIFNNSNSGSPFIQWQKGLSNAKGEVIWIAESDDWAGETFLETTLHDMVTDRSILLSYCQSVDVDENGKAIADRICWTQNFTPNIWKDDFIVNGQDFAQYLLYKNVVPNVSACIFQKEQLIKVIEDNRDFFDFKLCGDWFIFSKIACWKNSKIAFNKQCLNYFRYTSNSTRSHDSYSKRKLRLVEEARIVAGLDSTVETWPRKKEILKKWFELLTFKPKRTVFEICDEIKIPMARISLIYLTYLFQNRFFTWGKR